MKAYPTLYRGIQMRSRLEAKWAALFDALGWTWDYEPLDLPGWIPDFFVNIPEFKLPFLIDVKPTLTLPRDIEIKIERALGAPEPSETRKGPYSNQAWVEFYQKRTYNSMVVGLRPLIHGVDILEWEEPDGRISLGWYLENNNGWQFAYDFCRWWTLNDAWKIATNAVQWKAPR